MSALVQRLGINRGRYYGEGIQIEPLLEQIHLAATGSGWSSEQFYAGEKFVLRAYHRPSPSQPAPNIYVSTGIHGDEPAGPLAVHELFRQKSWPARVNLWLCPCLNPTGFPLNQRENADGVDLNRDYRHLNTVEVQAHVKWLERQPRFDCGVLLHEDWEAGGYYIYELNPDNLPSPAADILRAVAPVCPIESATLVDNFSVANGVIRPQVRPKDRPQWAEAIYLVGHKSRRNYTIEAPSDFPLAIRVEAHVRAMRTFFDWLATNLI